MISYLKNFGFVKPEQDIFRVENANGGGLYWGNDFPFSHEMVDKMRHPVPENDSKLGKFWNNLSWTDKDKYIFGYSSLEQLKNWIYQDSWREEINREGFRISVYSCVDFHTGDTQAVFIRRTATLKYSLSLLEI